MNITIIFNGTAHAMRKWPVCPRVGDYVLLGSTNPLKPHRLRVVSLLWQRDEDPRVDLICKEPDMSDLIERLEKLHGLHHHPPRAFETAAEAYLARAKADEPSDETPVDWPFGGDQWEPGYRRSDAEHAAAYAHLEQRVWAAAGGGRQDRADAIIREANELLAGSGK